MGYRILAEVVMVLHLGFLAYLVLGGVLALRWRRTIVLHMLTVAWAVGSLRYGYECPLTHLESWARAAAGGPRLPDTGFIDHYLVDVLFPAESEQLVQVLVGVVVAASWVGLVAQGRRRSRPGQPASR